MALGVGLRRRMPRVALSGIALRLRVGAALMVSLVFSVCESTANSLAHFCPAFWVFRFSRVSQQLVFPCLPLQCREEARSCEAEIPRRQYTRREPGNSRYQTNSLKAEIQRCFRVARRFRCTGTISRRSGTSSRASSRLPESATVL